MARGCRGECSDAIPCSYKCALRKLQAEREKTQSARRVARSILLLAKRGERIDAAEWEQSWSWLTDST